MSTVWQTSNTDRKHLTEDIHSLLDAASVCDWLCPKDLPVILKPNFVVSKPASSGATTHPEIAAAVIEYLQDLGYSDITIAEGSWVGDSTSRAFRVCGYTGLARRYGIELIDLQKDESVNLTTRGEKLKICRTIAETADRGGSLINLPVLKGHGQTRLTCALKNLKGCIPDPEKRRYHSLGVHRPVALLNTVIKPAFTLVDGLNGDPSWEEGGSPDKRDLLLLGRDSVSIDMHACRLLDIEPSDVKYIGMAADLGVGSAEVSCRMLSRSAGTGFSSGGAEEKSWVNNIVDQRSACSACFGNLAAALREIRNETPDAAARLKPASICIGQDFKNVKLPECCYGIGICTRGANSLEGCPPSLESIKRFLLKI